MYYLLFFILGFACAQYILPLLDSIWGLIMTRIEIPKGEYSLQLTKINQQINNLTDESGPQPVIGFTYSEEEDYQGEENE